MRSNGRDFRVIGRPDNGFREVKLYERATLMHLYIFLFFFFPRLIAFRAEFEYAIAWARVYRTLATNA